MRALALTVLTACGSVAPPPPYEYSSDRNSCETPCGLRAHGLAETCSALDALEGKTLLAFAPVYGDVSCSALSRVEAYVVPDSAEGFGYGEVRFAGRYHADLNRIEIADIPLGRAFVHELAHAVEDEGLRAWWVGTKDSAHFAWRERGVYSAIQAATR